MFCETGVNSDRVLLFSDWRYAWVSKDAMTRVVYRYQVGLLGRGLVLFPTSNVKGVSTMLLAQIPNYPHALSHVM